MTSSEDIGTDAVRDGVRDYLRRSQAKLRLRHTRGLPGRFDREGWRELAALGLHGAAVAEENGGLGSTLAEMAAIAQELGAFAMPEPFAAASVGVGRLLQSLPAGARRDALLGRLADGSLVAGIAWQDSAGQLEPAAAGVKLAAAAGTAALDGTRRFVVPGTGADGWLVLAEGARGPALVWVAAGQEGVTCRDLSRADATPMADLGFANARVEAADVLAQGDDVLRAVGAALDTVRLMLAGELVGGMRRMLDITLEYMRTRVQFGKPIGSFQALKHRAVDARLALELAQGTLSDAIARIGADPSCLAREASRAKARACASAVQVGRFATQCHGAMGVTDECDIGLYFKRALGLHAWLGTPAALRARFATLDTREAAAQDEPAWDGGAFPRDADWEAMEEPRFRAMVRAFVRAYCPSVILNLPRTAHWKEYQPWFMALSRQGWVAPAWPKEFGGMALSPGRLMAFFEEFENLGVPRAADFGITMIGPLLIRHGTPKQQAELIPAILRGEYVWSQGYSEPGAGSDLASLRTQAVLDGDHFVVDGQKIWNGHANSATHMFMLVRTAKGARKQEGISFLLVDLKTPGVTVRGIRDINGEEKLCEVFFDGARVPVANLVGEMHQGWSLAKSLLGYERLYLGSPKQAQNALAKLLAVAAQLGLARDPVFAARLTECVLDVRDAAALYGDYAAIFKAGKPIPPGVGLLKVVATETYQRVCFLLNEAVQEYGGLSGAHEAAGGVDTVSILLTSLPSSIYGGSNEIQRNVVAKAVLDLPD